MTAQEISFKSSAILSDKNGIEFVPKSNREKFIRASDILRGRLHGWIKFNQKFSFPIS